VWTEESLFIKNNYFLLIFWTLVFFSSWARGAFNTGYEILPLGAPEAGIYALNDNNEVLTTAENERLIENTAGAIKAVPARYDHKYVSGGYLYYDGTTNVLDNQGTLWGPYYSQVNLDGEYWIERRATSYSKYVESSCQGFGIPQNAGLKLSKHGCFAAKTVSCIGSELTRWNNCKKVIEYFGSDQTNVRIGMFGFYEQNIRIIKVTANKRVAYNVTNGSSGKTDSRINLTFLGEDNRIKDMNSSGVVISREKILFIPDDFDLSEGGSYKKWVNFELLADFPQDWSSIQLISVNENGVILGQARTESGWLRFAAFPTPLDSDGDGILNQIDNCPNTPNPDQADLDGDGIGNACDTDVDGDSVEDILDNCPLISNTDQLDLDGDFIGDACDDLVDNDADGIANDLDNCPAVPNTDQADNDGDSQGDACDLDDDNDGVEDTVDNCSLIPNEDQGDNDNDNIGDVCDSDDDNDAIEDDLDNCPLIANVSQDDNDGDGFGDVCDPDDDNDAVEDLVDNCPLSFNPDQSNSDGAGAGDACNDAFDVDDDDWENDYDNCPDVANRNQSDFDYDNIGDACDTDVDGDSAANAADACELTPVGELVGSIGCSIEQLCPCDAPRQSTEPWKNHGKYVSCMTKAAKSFAADGVISNNGKSDLVNAAAQSICGY